MTEEDTIAAGNRCEFLMRDDTFNEMYGTFNEQTVRFLLATQPHEAKKRESLYAELQGLKSFLDLLMENVSARNQIIEARNAKDAAAAEEDTSDE